MMVMRQMHANLMGSSCLKRYLESCMMSKTFHHSVMGNGWFSGIYYGHTFAMQWIAANGCINRTPRRDYPHSNRFVLTFDFTILQLLYQAGIGRESFGDN